MKTLIKRASIVLPNEIIAGSLLIDGAKIAAVDAAIHTEADEVIDASGLHLLPGVVDDQVHFRDPGLTAKEDLYTGSRACAKGGVTSFLEMPNTRPATTSQQALDAKLERAATKSLVNFGFYIGATDDNLEQLKRTNRTPGIKIFIGSSTGNMLVDEQSILESIFAETSLPITAHCEDETTVRANRRRFAGTSDVADHSQIRDHRTAYVATQRATDLARRHRHRFHVLHVSTGAEVELFREHDELLTAEVCPHHLLFNTDDYPRLGSLIQMNPSVKFVEDNKQLWQALQNGDIQVVATDHAPHTWEEKQQPYPASPSGLPAVENSLALMLDQHRRGQCTLHQIVHWMSDAPARVWDLVDKGRIEVGYDADLVLVDLELTRPVLDEQQESKCRWSPWHGTSLTGWPVRTWVMGHQVFCEGDFAESCRGSEILFDHQRGGYWATTCS